MAFEFVDGEGFPLVCNPNQQACSTFKTPRDESTAAEDSDDGSSSLPRIVSVVSVQSHNEESPQKGRKKAAPRAAGSSAKKSKAPSAANKVDIKAIVTDLIATAVHAEYADLEFADRALMNLARRLAAKTDAEEELDRWRRCSSGDQTVGCITITRPKDGRLTVAKSSATSTKKVFPQILAVQLFRWPRVFFHSDVRSDVTRCRHSAVIKPNAESQTLADELICINPQHYMLTADGEARLAKLVGNDRSTAKAGRKKSKTGAKRTITGDEVQDFDAQGVDYLKVNFNVLLSWQP